MSKIAVIGIVGNSVFLPVEKFHVGGETVEAKSIHFELGGKGFNQAIASARYGAEVSFLAAVGQDSIVNVKSFLEKEKVKATLIEKQDQTAFAAIVTDANGSNHVTVYQGAQLSTKDVDQFENDIKQADVLLLNNEVAQEVNVRAIEIAKRYNVKVVLNPAPARETCEYILNGVDLFTPNEHETEGLEDKMNVIITLGKEGCLIKAENKKVSSIKVKAVDTTGAGDTFNGVLVACLANGDNVETACRTANVAAAIKVTKTHVLQGIPHKKEIENYLKNARN